MVDAKEIGTLPLNPLTSFATVQRLTIEYQSYGTFVRVLNYAQVLRVRLKTIAHPGLLDIPFCFSLLTLRFLPWPYPIGSGGKVK